MLRDVIEKSFVLVPADWPVGDVQRVVRQLSPTHLVVHITAAAGTGAYYLFRANEALDLLGAADDQQAVLAVLGLDQRAATPTLDAYDDELNAPDQAVVLDEGRVVGFLDSEISGGVAWIPISRQGTAESIQVTPRSLVTDFPRQVVVGETHSLLVRLSRDSSAGQLPVVVATGMVVDVIVQPRRGFELVDSREDSISVTDADESLPLQFKLKATHVGLGTVQICVFSGGRSLGVLTIESRVVASTDEIGGSPPPMWKKPLPPSIPATAPDLTLIITHKGDRFLNFTLRTRDPDASPKTKQQFGPVQIGAEPFGYFRGFFTEIQKLPTDTPADKHAAEQELGARGDLLFKTLPQELRLLLWNQRQRIHTVQIQSQEPWIPWELCRLQGRDDNRIQSGEFFAEAFAITRWLPDLADKPKLTLRKLALVVPERSGLKHAPSEKKYMLSLSGSERRVECIPANRDDVLAALRDGGYDGWHFTGHGKIRHADPDYAELELDEGVISPALLGGEVENLGLHQPFVFLNACQSGQLSMSLTDIGGWAARFLRAAADDQHPANGAAAFIGTYWEIDDLAAFEFAKAFYTALLQGKRPVGEAAKQARSAIRSRGGLDRLAYTVFAHPLATVE
jgi:hypothetical protein